jgi:anti-sigma regulatory factor (Ser/Thr protein kinase)
MVLLVLSYDRRELGRLSDWLDEQENVLRIPGKTAYAVRLCLEEAIANLIEHTPPAAKGPDITVALDWQDDALVAELSDRGPPFDPRQVATPARPANLDSAKPGGLGIHLMRSFASRVDYASDAGQNRLTMRFAVPAQQAS